MHAPLRHVTTHVHGAFALAVFTGVALVACGGGGGGGSTPATTPVTPVSNVAPTAQPQVITMALPQSVMGQLTDPTFGVIGGYTQSTYSQVLAFAPNSQVMLANGQAGQPHTLDVIAQSGPFPSSPTLSTNPAGGSTLAAGFASGTLNGGSEIGPVTLSAGTYFVGCAFHYVSNMMRTVLIVAAAATPGPQATAPPGSSPPPSMFGY
jgi:hypothetical protein